MESFKALSLALVALGGIAWGAHGDQLFIKSSNGVNLRGSPRGADVGGVPSGVSVDILARDGDWAQVTYGGQTGWVYTPSATEVRAGGTDHPEGEAAPPATPADAAVAIVDANNVRFRVADGDDVIDSLDKGTRVRVVGEAAGGWTPVEWDGIRGVISSQFLQAGRAEDIPPAPPALEVDVQTRAYLRASPGSSGEKIGTLTNGAKLFVIGKPDGEWVPVRTLSGVFGWVHESLLNAIDGGQVVSEARAYGEAAGIDSPPVGVLTVTDGSLESDTEAGFECLACKRGAAGNAAFLAPIENDDGGGNTDVKVGKGGFTNPLAGHHRISSPFGERTAPISGASTNHGGVDLATPTNTPVMAAKGGTILRVVSSCKQGDRTCNGRAGNMVVIQHPDGTRTRYFHLNSVSAKVGEHVDIGEVIAKSGMTGNASGPHLHFEIQVRDKNGSYIKVNPANYLIF